MSKRAVSYLSIEGGGAEETYYPITPHIKTCAYNTAIKNFSIFDREKETDISTCAYVQPSLLNVH